MFFFVKQKTAYEMRISDWSSDVCSSDLPEPPLSWTAAPWPGSDRMSAASPAMDGRSDGSMTIRGAILETSDAPRPYADSRPIRIGTLDQFGSTSCRGRVGQTVST